MSGPFGVTVTVNANDVACAGAYDDASAPVYVNVIEEGATRRPPF